MAQVWDGTAVPAQDRSGTDAEMRVSRQDPKNAKGRLRRERQDERRGSLTEARRHGGAAALPNDEWAKCA